ncbi:hypothetical protein [Rhodopseudomonas faecalis]|uniref:hypothetical protein n=1 Tax=Rhodopseudomonas faecalis TaxID=99655 RepID=UPI000DA23C3D|nr:hypothetical protein [Rhodopseudomonas faecalis]
MSVSSHGHGHSGHHHVHAHGADAPHPAQPPGWSMLRMALTGRLLVAGVLSAVLWAFVLTAIRP